MGSVGVGFAGGVDAAFIGGGGGGLAPFVFADWAPGGVSGITANSRSVDACEGVAAADFLS
jgi:hypothetical protein